MLWHIAEWAGLVLAAGVVAGLVVLAAGVAGAWWLYRVLRGRVEILLASATARYGLQPATVAAAVRQWRLPPQVVHELRRRLGGAPELE